ncbi:stage II sporulation protein R [Clostridium algifaecis]|uniref:Stage II sporulation protein R n=1 Tax=Clostridium algifaecis TaxID=1472040 RepID=A0ABS4KQP7_9CLOT|nr:stage II sporulation protein R [Clostridium algifaecis]MBP2032365.1 stage II sporulation protein R [Clostridium algifaecis]
MKRFFSICVLCILVIFTLNITASCKNLDTESLNQKNCNIKLNSRDYQPVIPLNKNINSDNEGNDDVQQSIASKIIRFHIIANSDTKSDQALKLKVRDEILKYISPKLENSKDINQSREVLKQNNKNILDIARKVINEEGYTYGVASTLSKVNFPIKTYGNITLPQGTYEAYRIVIGKGQGQNWWCVMFPPLCFVDVSKGQASYKQTEKQMKNVLNKKEYNSIDNGIEDLDNKNIGKNIEVRFKIIDFIKKLGI